MRDTRYSMGVLDLCRLDGRSPRAALMQTVELAVAAEAAGYSRYWLAEHHDASSAHASPEILTAAVAGVTETMRVGPAGILLHFYSPLKVAEDFRLLATLYPGRIDLGLARGFTDEHVAARLLDGRPAQAAIDGYDGKVRDVLAYLSGEDELGLPAMTEPSPEVWVLGSGGQSVDLASATGAHFALSLFLKAAAASATPAVTAGYRSAVRRLHDREGHCSIALGVVCADSRERAEDIAAAYASPAIAPLVVGGPGQCRSALDDLAAAYGADDVVVLDACTRFEDRLRSYELLAQACM